MDDYRIERQMRDDDVRMANEEAALARQAALREIDPDIEFCSLECEGDHDAGW